jgi:hypothetical protein
VGKSKWKRGGSANNGSGGGVLRDWNREKMRLEQGTMDLQIVVIAQSRATENNDSLEIRGMGT